MTVNTKSLLYPIKYYIQSGARKHFIDLQLARPLPNSIFVDIYKCLFYNPSQYTGTIKSDGLWIKFTNYTFINTDPNLLKMSLEMFSETLNGSNPAFFWYL